ncbi:hypothetical protein L1987_19155 [Smallanthus sonchifolius]|uniref:Uncharacterized protein n=1 Tax=Smallanthus sonchifolius TaxID=185202 RepID=A0ACB9J4A0_9ASTR|nr:hypothetical protein L1987_19155 [Smallanthus sonchifolius]
MESVDLGKGIQLLSGFVSNGIRCDPRGSICLTVVVRTYLDSTSHCILVSIVDKMFKTGTIKRLGEKVSKIVICVNFYKFNQVLFSTVSNEMVANFNMLSFRMFHRVVCDGHGGIVVNEQWSSSVVQAIIS